MVMNFLKIRKIHRKTSAPESLFFGKATNWRPTTLFTKESPEQMFSCEFCKVFKNTYFEEKMLLYRSSHRSHQKYSIKKLFLKISQYSQETQMFSYEYYKIFRSNYFEKHLRKAASVCISMNILKGIFPNISTAKFILKV